MKLKMINVNLSLSPPSLLCALLPLSFSLLPVEVAKYEIGAQLRIGANDTEFYFHVPLQHVNSYEYDNTTVDKETVFSTRLASF